LNVVVVAVDQYGFDVARCLHTIFVPGITDLKCTAVCPSPVLYNPNTGGNHAAPPGSNGSGLSIRSDTIQSGSACPHRPRSRARTWACRGDRHPEGTVFHAQFYHIEPTWTLAVVKTPETKPSQIPIQFCIARWPIHLEDVSDDHHDHTVKHALPCSLSFSGFPISFHLMEVRMPARRSGFHSSPTTRRIRRSP